MSRRDFPTTEEGLELHRRLLENDIVAPMEVCERYAEPLCDFLLYHSRRADEHACTSAAYTALLDYLRRPEMFDPAQLDLAAFLRMAARRDLSNLDRAEAKHHRHREPNFRVEDANVGGNHFEDDPAMSLVRLDEQEIARRRMEAVRVECDEMESRILDLMLEGERSTKRYAAALEVEHSSDEDQRREVKRAKDRIKKRIERGGGSYGEAFGRDGRADSA